MARPGGNPDLKKHQYTTDRTEPYVVNLQICVTASLKEAVTSRPGWRDWVRAALEKEFAQPDNN